MGAMCKENRDLTEVFVMGDSVIATLLSNLLTSVVENKHRIEALEDDLKATKQYIAILEEDLKKKKGL